MSVLLAFLAALVWGASDYWGGLAAKKIHYLMVTLLRECLLSTCFGVVILATNSVFHWSDLAVTLVLGAVIAYALPLFFEALANGRMALVAPVAGTVGVMVPIVVGLVGGERPSVLQGFGLVIAVVAVLLLSVEHIEHEGDVRRHWAKRDIITATFCGLVFGSYYSVIHHTSHDSGAWPVFGVSLGIILVLLPRILLHKDAKVRSATWSDVRLCFLGGVADSIANGLYVVATRQGLLSITATVSSLYPVATALLAWWFLKEKLSRFNVLGLVLCGVCLGLVAS